MVHGGAFTVGRFRPFQFICRKVQLKPGGFAHTALSQSIFSLGGQYLVCLPSVGASRRISGLERSVSSRLTDYVSLSHLTIPGTSHNTTQTTPAASHRTTASSQKEIPPAKQGLQIAKKQLAGHSSHLKKSHMPEHDSSPPGKDSSMPGDTPSDQETTHASQEDTRWDSHFATHTFHSLTPHMVSHLSPRTPYSPASPRSTSHRIIPHISHLTPHNSSQVERTLANQARTPACQEQT